MRLSTRRVRPERFIVLRVFGVVVGFPLPGLLTRSPRVGRFLLSFSFFVHAACPAAARAPTQRSHEPVSKFHAQISGWFLLARSSDLSTRALRCFLVRLELTLELIIFTMRKICSFWRMRVWGEGVGLQFK